jgi:predicted Zn-dependent protease
MRKLALIPACFLVTVPFFTHQVNAQIASLSGSSISGQVFAPQRIPVTQIPVELMNDVNSVIQRTKTDGSGRYFFRGLTQGRFSIRVLPLGTDLQEQTQDVEISGMGVMGRPLSDNIQSDFYLRLRRQKASNKEITGTIFVQEIPEQARKSYQKGVELIGAKDTNEGLKEIKSAIELFPDYYDALDRLGNEYIKLQHFVPAQILLQKAVQVNPRGYRSWYGLAYANYSLNNNNEAIEAAQKAYGLDQRSAETALLLGTLLRRVKDYENAEKNLKKANELSGNIIPEVHWQLALLYGNNLNRYQDAAKELELFLKTASDVKDEEAIKKLIKQFKEKAQKKST